jgi:LysM repeat protein
VKALIALCLAIAVFGAGGYFTFKLYLEPQQKLQKEKQLGPPPAMADPTIAEFEKCRELQQSEKLLEARTALSDFVERYPESTKLDEAKDLLGEINMRIFLSNYPAPEKEAYVVQKGEVILKVAAKMHTTPELIMRANDLRSTMLRIGQRISVSPSDFSLLIERGRSKVVVLNNGKFFKQYTSTAAMAPLPARAAAASEKKGAPTPKPPKIVGKVTEKIAWRNGQRVTPFDKAYLEADHWIVISPAGHSLYTSHVDGQPPNKPPGGGYGLAPDAMQELAAILNKNTPVTIE